MSLNAAYGFGWLTYTPVWGRLPDRRDANAREQTEARFGSTRFRQSFLVGALCPTLTHFLLLESEFCFTHHPEPPLSDKKAYAYPIGGASNLGTLAARGVELANCGFQRYLQRKANLAVLHQRKSQGLASEIRKIVASATKGGQ